MKYFLMLLLVILTYCTSKKEVTPPSFTWDRVKSYYITTKLNGNSTLHIITTLNPTPFVQDYDPAKLLAIKAVLDQGPAQFDRVNLVIEPIQKPTAMQPDFFRQLRNL